MFQRLQLRWWVSSILTEFVCSGEGQTAEWFWLEAKQSMSWYGWGLWDQKVGRSTPHVIQIDKQMIRWLHIIGMSLHLCGLVLAQSDWCKYLSLIDVCHFRQSFLTRYLSILVALKSDVRALSIRVERGWRILRRWIPYTPKPHGGEKEEAEPAGLSLPLRWRSIWYDQLWWWGVFHCQVI